MLKVFRQRSCLAKLDTVQYEKPVPEVLVLLQYYLYTDWMPKITGLDLSQNKVAAALTHLSPNSSWSTNLRSGMQLESSSAW